MIADVAALPTFVTVNVYADAVPTVKLAEPAVFTICNCGAFVGVLTVLEQFGFVWLGQLGSPPPLIVAVFAMIVPLAAACGVTLIVKLADPAAARPVGTVQVTVCPLIEHPGALLIVTELGTLSTIVIGAVVAALPMLFAVSV